MTRGHEILERTMIRRAIQIVTVMSTILLGVLVVLLFLSADALANFLNPWDHYLSLGDALHIGVWGSSGLDSRVVFFNDSDYGPYRGSITGVIGADGVVYPPLLHQRAFGDSWGIYYRYFRWSDSTLWTWMISLWYPIVVCAILPGAQLVRYWRKKMIAQVH